MNWERIAWALTISCGIVSFIYWTALVEMKQTKPHLIAAWSFTIIAIIAAAIAGGLGK